MVEPSSRKLFGPHALPIKGRVAAGRLHRTRQPRFIAAIEAGMPEKPRLRRDIIYPLPPVSPAATSAGVGPQKKFSGLEPPGDVLVAQALP